MSCDLFQPPLGSTHKWQFSTSFWSIQYSRSGSNLAYAPGSTWFGTSWKHSQSLGPVPYEHQQSGTHRSLVLQDSERPWRWLAQWWRRNGPWRCSKCRDSVLSNLCKNNSNHLRIWTLLIWTPSLSEEAVIGNQRQGYQKRQLLATNVKATYVVGR